MALNRKVLKLSKSYEPEGVITMMRAFLLVYRGRAEVVMYDEGQMIHSTTTAYKAPSIIRVLDYHDLRKKRNVSGKQRLRIFIRDKFRCQYCCKKFPPQELTRDHIIPQAQGGSDDPENLATSCKPCNNRKGNRTPDEARMPLLATPSALKYGLDRALLAHYAVLRPEWVDYLFLGKGRAAA